MNKEKFIEMLDKAKEDEYGRLYVLGEYDNKIYFGTITTVCEDIFVLNHGEEYRDTAELYDRHFWNDDTFECHVVSTSHVANIKYKEPKRIEKLSINELPDYFELVEKVNELIEMSDKYARVLEIVERSNR